MEQLMYLAIGFGPIAAFAQIAPARAAEIKIMAPRAIWTVLNEAGPEFEAHTGYKLNVSVDPARVVLRRVKAGERFDIAVVTPTHIDELVGDGKLIANTCTNLTRCGIGVEVRKGAPKPDISTVEAFKNAMVNAKSVGYLKAGPSGLMVAAMLDRIGLTETLKSKVVLSDDDNISELIADGKIEVGMVVMTQIVTTPGVDLVGPLPEELQSYVVFAAGVSTESKALEAARELIRFLKGPAVAVIRAQGMEPG